MKQILKNYKILILLPLFLLAVSCSKGNPQPPHPDNISETNNSNSTSTQAPESKSENDNGVSEKLKNPSRQNQTFNPATPSGIQNPAQTSGTEQSNSTPPPAPPSNSSPNPAVIVIPQSTAPAPTPAIKEFFSSVNSAKVGSKGLITYRAENSVVCALTETKDISVPFVGRLPEGEVEVTFSESVLKDNKFTYYLICADKDWKTVIQTIFVALDESIDPVQPYQFFFTGGDAVGALNGVPFIQISGVKNGVTATLEIKTKIVESNGSPIGPAEPVGKSYSMDDQGRFMLNDITRTENYPTVATSYSYIIHLLFTDSISGQITGEKTGGFSY